MTDEREREKAYAQEYITCFLCGSEVKLSLSYKGCHKLCYDREHD